MSIESELKLALEPAVVQQLLKSKCWKPMRVGRAKRLSLVSTYFDTPRHLLRKAGVALRIRENGNTREQTLKAPAAGPAGLQNFHEWTQPVKGTVPLLEPIRQSGAVPLLAQRRTSERLRPVFTTQFDRTAMLVKRGSTLIELAVDTGAIRVERNGAVREEPICELELELVEGDAAEVSDLALQICEQWSALPMYQTKAQRGYALANRSLRPAPAKPAEIVLNREMTAGEAFQLIVAQALAHLHHNRQPTLEGKPEAVHQTRVAMRRLRAALWAFKKLLPYRERKGFNGELRWFQHRLAPARDWHVFLTETIPGIGIDRHIGAADAQKLKRVAAYERRRTTKAAIEHLQSRRYARLVLEFQKWVAGLEKSVPKKVWNQPIVPFARRTLHRISRELLEENRPLSRLPVEELHVIRKRGKKARYATEFFCSLWTDEDFRPFAKLMSKLQNRLGEANDAGVAGRILLSLRPGRLDPDLLQQVQDLAHQRVHERVSAARPHWRRFRKARPFWTGPAAHREAAADA